MVLYTYRQAEVGVSMAEREDAVSKGEDSAGAADAHPAALQQQVMELQATQRQLVTEIAALRQGQITQIDLLTKIERDLRRGRIVRRVWLIIRLLILFALGGMVIYYFMDWRSFLQIFV